MRSKISKMAKIVERLERLEYKTERRIDTLKRQLVELKNLIKIRKNEIVEQEKKNDATRV